MYMYILEDVGHNADLYIANQEDNTQPKLGTWPVQSFEQRQSTKL